MTNIDEIVKIFYGKYGYAMHTAQILERGLLELYALQKYTKDNLTEVEYYTILSNPNKWTLGGIINAVKAYNLFDNDKQDLLKKVNANRVFLAHMFWWERNIVFDNQVDLENLLNEILSYINLNNSFIPIVDSMIRKIRIDNNLNIERKMGLTNFNDREAFIKNLKK